uniref:Uncharacterized protein n=1 Tax=Rhizophora mucronata TaxID=61149 RepID=A0A2P2IZ08_RHIMU
MLSMEMMKSGIGIDGEGISTMSMSRSVSFPF